MAYLCFVSECTVCFASFDLVCNQFENGVWGVVWRILCVSMCMLTVSYALLMARATAIVVNACCNGVVYVV